MRRFFLKELMIFGCFLWVLNDSKCQTFTLKILDINEDQIDGVFCRTKGRDLQVDPKGNVNCEHNILYEIGAPGYDTIFVKATPAGNKIKEAEVQLDKDYQGSLGCADDQAPFKGKLSSFEKFGDWNFRYVQYEDGNDTGDSYQRVTEFQNLVQRCMQVDNVGYVKLNLKYKAKGYLTLETKKKKKNSDSKINVVLTDDSDKKK